MAGTVAEPVQIREATDVTQIAREMIGDDLKIKEYFLAITLDGASNIISARIIHIGTLNQSLVHPRDVFRPAILDNAASVRF
jgi:DNA repair protein RadC